MSMHSQILARFDHEWQTISGPNLANYGALGTLTGFEAYARLSESGSDRDTLYYQAVLDARTEPAVERLLLQLFLSRAIALTKTCKNLIHLKKTEGMDAAISFSLNAVWEAIRTLPETATEHVPGQIAMRALQHVTRGYYFDQQSFCLDPQEETFEQNEDALTGYQAGSPSSDLAEVMNVLHWAVDSSVLTPEEARFLGQYTVATEQERREMAQELQISWKNLVDRASRIRVHLARGLARKRIERGALV